MREIKYRARNANLPQGWIYGYFVVENGCNYIINNEGKFGVIVYTEGQYTGLKDKNGDEIYGGDIIKFVDEHRNYEKFGGEVKFGKGLQGEPADWEGPFWGWIVGETEPLIDDFYNIEIVGNKFENPELLERRKQ